MSAWLPERKLLDWMEDKVEVRYYSGWHNLNMHWYDNLSWKEYIFILPLQNYTSKGIQHKNNKTTKLKIMFHIWYTSIVFRASSFYELIMQGTDFWQHLLLSLFHLHANIDLNSGPRRYKVTELKCLGLVIRDIVCFNIFFYGIQLQINY